MEHVSIDDVDSNPYDDDLHAERRALADPLDIGHVALTRYVLEPGDRFSGSIHAHFDQEEVFVVLEGEATFVTRSDERGEDESEYDEVAVAENEAIRFAPGEFQSGRNDGDERVVALAARGDRREHLESERGAKRPVSCSARRATARTFESSGFRCSRIGTSRVPTARATTCGFRDRTTPTSSVRTRTATRR